MADKNHGECGMTGWEAARGPKTLIRQLRVGLRCDATRVPRVAADGEVRFSSDVTLIGILGYFSSRVDKSMRVQRGIAYGDSCDRVLFLASRMEMKPLASASIGIQSNSSGIVCIM